MVLVVVDAEKAGAGTDGEVTLAAGANMSMRLWRDEQPHDKAPHKSPYETLGYVISGRADLMVEGETTTLKPGVSYLVPANAEHTYKILERFTAVEVNAPAQGRPKDFSKN